MRKSALVLASILLLAPVPRVPAQSAGGSPPPAAPPPPSCAAAEYRQFDFWVGEWEVKLPNGRVAGHNSIQPILDGCALREEWRSAGRSRGTSVNFYDASSGTWRQTWIDNAGQPLYLVGRLHEGRMVMEQTSTDASGKTTRHRITWTPLDGGEVRQHWETSIDGGTTWTTLFDGRYHRVPPS